MVNDLNVSTSMAEPPFAMAIDIGSSSVRAIVFDNQGREIEGAGAQIAYDLDSTPEGGATIDPHGLRRLAESCIDEMLAAFAETHESIQTVGTSCFWHSLLGLDNAGQPVTPIFHLADTRSSNQVAELRERLDEPEWRKRTGTVFHSSYWPAKVAWLTSVDPSLVQSVATWVSAADYLSRSWLGVTWTSLCMASGTGMCDLETGTWRIDLAEIVGAESSALPPIVDLDERRTLLPEYAARWPRLATAEWYPPLGDGACANVGCGAVDDSRIALTVGTTAAMRMFSHRPVGAPVEMYESLWAYRLDRETVVYGAAITNGGLWVDWIRDLFHDETVLEAAFALEPGAHALTVLPFLSGERFPIWNDQANAVIAGLTARTLPADIARAAIEALGIRVAIMYNAVRHIAAENHQVIANGAAILKSAELRQIISDAMHAPVAALPADLESSGRGAALLALRSEGVIRSLSDAIDPVCGAPPTRPDSRAGQIYDDERLRHEKLRLLLYPDTNSWDMDFER